MLESVTQFTENYLNKKSDRLQKAQTFFATKAVQSIPLRHRFVIDFFAILLLLSTPLSRLVGAFTLQRKLCSLDLEQICRSAHSKRYSCCNNDKVALLQIAKLYRTLQSVSDEFVSVCFLFDNACSDTP